MDSVTLLYVLFGIQQAWICFLAWMCFDLRKRLNEKIYFFNERMDLSSKLSIARNDRLKQKLENYMGCLQHQIDELKK